MDANTWMLILAIVYFVPSIIALNRGHANRMAIIVTNVLLGWTLIGWIIALIWSCTANLKQPNRLCPICHERGFHKDSCPDWRA